MRVFAKITAGFLFCLLLVVVAKADSVSYNLTTANGNTVQFTLPNNSKPSGSEPGRLVGFYDVQGTFNGRATVFTVEFFTGSNQFLQNGVDVSIGDPRAPYTMFFGTGKNPVFSGDANSVELFGLDSTEVSTQYIFTPWQNYLNYVGDPLQFSGSATTIPEPGALALLCLGMVFLLGFRRKLMA